jgi:hypothetical protein
MDESTAVYLHLKARGTLKMQFVNGRQEFSKPESSSITKGYLVEQS